MDKTNKDRLREKVSRRAFLLNAVEDYNIEILALTGEIRYLDSEIEWLTEDVKLEAIRVANEKFRKFEKSRSKERFKGYTASDIAEMSPYGGKRYDDGMEKIPDESASKKNKDSSDTRQ